MVAKVGRNASLSCPPVTGVPTGGLLIVITLMVLCLYKTKIGVELQEELGRYSGKALRYSEE